ncbi:hypothetical protein [Streptomyces calidiresistens]|uniref:Secreted protein n=1 Tax=Streptomyces calidiresistens TaxID=1485586 RepID=A0A7W3XXL1_9ACTN|nr:hypothetical protein [Streptomyces calidiresistens]MBB0231024.1 hypothetical protein [Streptomyces calidiresistens]
MQLPAGAALPHTRSRAVHWVLTAAALGAVIGVLAVARPPAAGASPASGEGPDPASAAYPVDCGPHGVAITHRAAVDLDGDGRPETVAAIRCDAAGGTPPGGVYLLTGGAGGEPRVAATLVDPADGMIVDEVIVDGDGLVVRLLGYSGPDVPRSEPDLYGEAAWSWRDGALVREQRAPLTAVAV